MYVKGKCVCVCVCVYVSFRREGICVSMYVHQCVFVVRECMCGCGRPVICAHMCMFMCVGGRVCALGEAYVCLCVSLCAWV